MTEKVGLYVRVSTSDQSADRQVEALKEFANEHYPSHEVEVYADVVSGSTRAGRDEYDRLWADIADGKVATVVVDEVSRLSRLGAGEIHRFLQHCVEHGTGFEDREVGLTISQSDGEVTHAMNEMIAGLLGSLAKIEHKQKLRRIRSGIDAAQDAGKWTGRPPRGFTVGEDGYLRVDVEEFLRTRAAVERVVSGEAATTVAEDVGLPSSTLSRLVSDRADLYLAGEADDDRVDAATDELRPLPEPEAAPADWRDEVRKIVRDELQ